MIKPSLGTVGHQNLFWGNMDDPTERRLRKRGNGAPASVRNVLRRPGWRWTRLIAHPNNSRSSHLKSFALKYRSDHASLVYRNIPELTAACCFNCGCLATSGFFADDPRDREEAANGAAAAFFLLEVLVFVTFFRATIVCSFLRIIPCRQLCLRQPGPCELTRGPSSRVCSSRHYSFPPS